MGRFPAADPGDRGLASPQTGLDSRSQLGEKAGFASRGPAHHIRDLAQRLCARMADWPRECFHLLYLDGRNRLIAEETLWEGTVNSVHIYPREVVRRTIETGATALIAVHNHPSGDPTPSPHDIAMTQRLRAACEAIDVILHDHLIVGRDGWLSMARAGLLTKLG